MYDKNDKNQYTSIHTHHTNTHTHTKTTVKKYIFIIYVKYCAVFHDEKLKYWLFIDRSYKQTHCHKCKYTNIV